MLFSLDTNRELNPFINTAGMPLSLALCFLFIFIGATLLVATTMLVSISGLTRFFEILFFEELSSLVYVGVLDLSPFLF